MALEILRVTDERMAREFHALAERDVPLDHAGLEAEPLEDLLGVLPDGTSTERMAFHVGVEDGAVVATSAMWLPLKENLHLAHVTVDVAREARRRGLGRAMAAHLLDLVRAQGRTTTVSFVGAPLGEEAPGDALASALGAKPALTSIRRELSVADVDDAALETMLTDTVRPRSVAYDVVRWIDVAPDEYVDGAAALLPHVFTDSPRGELEFEDEVWDGPRYREYERDVAARGRRLVATGAVERGTGRLVAYTDITVPRAREHVAGQWGTIVEEAHRGRRLGLLVKVENLRQLRGAFPAVERVTTWNAEENEHMIAVNELLGFRAKERYQAWQLTL